MSPQDLLQQSSTQNSNCYRLVVLGSARVGKSSLVARFLNNKFNDSYTPTIENFYRKVYRIRGEVYQLDILDTSGNHPFPAMQRLSFITGDLFLLVYSVDSRGSFEEVVRLREQIIETKGHIGGGGGGGSNTSGLATKKGSASSTHVPMVIAGNKCDRDMRTVTQEESSSVCADFFGCSLIETSAKKNLNVDELFRQLFQLADLPPEMAPNSHRRLLPGQLLSTTASETNQSTTSSSKSNGSGRRFRGFPQLPQISVRRRLSDAYGIVAPNVRRPSLRTDLMIMKKKTSRTMASSSNPTSSTCRGSSCVIQ